MLSIIRSPCCGSELSIESVSQKQGDHIKSGSLSCQSCSTRYPIERYVPRLVPKENYSSSWGDLWMETAELTRDSSTGLTFYRDVLHGSYHEGDKAIEGTSPFGFAWPTDLSGQLVLEVGPGTGCCTEHLVKTGCELVVIDMSHAIDSFSEELHSHSNLNVIQADINNPVLKKSLFDRIWLFQVLQHTPSPAATLKTMFSLLKEGGEISFTSYGGSTLFNPWYYRFTKGLGTRFGWKLINLYVPIVVQFKFYLHQFFDYLGFSRLANLVDRVLGFADPRNIYRRVRLQGMEDYPVGAQYKNTGDHRILMQFVILNTYDAITPEYSLNADHQTIEKWTAEAGFEEINSWGTGGVRAKAKRPR